MNIGIMIISTIASILGGMGLAVAFVEKRKEWPIRPVAIAVRKFLTKFNRKAHRVGKCTVCFSFWATGIIEIILNTILYIEYKEFSFMWPVTGFISLGLLWAFYQILEVFDRMSQAILYSK